MHKKQLKQIIKPLVKEIIAEMFMEMRLDQMIGEALDRGMKKNSIAEDLKNVKAKDPLIEKKLLEQRRKTLDELHGNTKPKNGIEAILHDTQESGFEIQSESEANTNPEFVSEDGLLDLMEGKDFSKFLS